MHACMNHSNNSLGVSECVRVRTHTHTQTHAHTSLKLALSHSFTRNLSLCHVVFINDRRWVLSVSLFHTLSLALMYKYMYKYILYIYIYICIYIPVGVVAL